VGVALFVEGIGGGGGGRGSPIVSMGGGGGGSGEYLKKFLGKTVDGILDIKIGVGGDYDVVGTDLQLL